MKQTRALLVVSKKAKEAILKMKKEHMISPKYVVNKANTINAMKRINNFTPLQLKIFYIYLAKVNPKEQKTKAVTMPISEYQYILNSSSIKRKQIIEEGNEITNMKIMVPVLNSKNEVSGTAIIPIFSQFTIFQSEEDMQWYISAECSEKIAPMLFDLKQYSSFQLWNIIGLSTIPEIRLYEILNQYAYWGSKTFQLDELREMLGLKDETGELYPRWSNFKTRILDKAKQSIEENTDLRFTYEPVKAEKNKVVAVKFSISSNRKSAQICRTLLDNMGYTEEAGYNLFNADIVQDVCLLDEMRKISNYEFNGKQIEDLYTLLKKLYGIEGTIIPAGYTYEEAVSPGFKKYAPITPFLKSFSEKYDCMCAANPRKRFGYLKKIILNKIEDQKS